MQGCKKRSMPNKEKQSFLSAIFILVLQVKINYSNID